MKLSHHYLKPKLWLIMVLATSFSIFMGLKRRKCSRKKVAGKCSLCVWCGWREDTHYCLAQWSTRDIQISSGQGPPAPRVPGNNAEPKLKELKEGMELWKKGGYRMRNAVSLILIWLVWEKTYKLKLIHHKVYNLSMDFSLQKIYYWCKYSWTRIVTYYVGHSSRGLWGLVWSDFINMNLVCDIESSFIILCENSTY